VGTGVGGTLGIPLIVGGIEGLAVGRAITVKIFEGCVHDSEQVVLVPQSIERSPLATVSPSESDIVQLISDG
jgi:hypothetical protein